MWPFRKATDEEAEAVLKEAKELLRPFDEYAAWWKGLTDEEKIVEAGKVTWDDTLRFFGMCPPKS